MSTLYRVRYIAFVVLVLPLALQAQNDSLKLAQEIQTRISNLPSESEYLRYQIIDTSFYGEIQRIWIAQQNISYGTIGNWMNSRGVRRSELREGEGKEGILLEANFDNRFCIAMGRPNNRPWFRRIRATFDYRGNFRMTKDDSSPIVPWSNDVGIGFDFSPYDSYKHWMKGEKRYDETSFRDTRSGNEEWFRLLTFTAQLHHYSNGQPPGVYYTDEDGNRRHDYKDGDFSTNYVRLRATYSWANYNQYSLYNLGLGFRADMGDPDKTFKYTVEQRQSYGYWRAELYGDWFTRDFSFLKRLHQLHFRFEGELIVDDVSKFEPNLRNPEGDYRFSWHGFIEWRPLNHRSLGYMLHLFSGRDYLNIRYDDIIFLAEIGLSLSLDKYYPTGWRSKNTRWFKKHEKDRIMQQMR